MPYGNQIWYEEPLVKVQSNDVVEIRVGVSQCQLEVKLLRY